MDRKIIFFDIDGTLYVYGKKILDSTVEAIRMLKENGHIPVICTGRTKSMIFPEIFDIGFDSLISGGGTYAEYQGKKLYLECMDKEAVEDVAETMSECGIVPIPEGHEHMYIDKNNIPDSYREVYTLYEEKIGDKIEPIDYENMSVSKISGKIEPYSDIATMEKKYSKDYTIINHAGELLELIPKPYTKAVGIERMIKYLDIPVENTYAFGDSFNDVEMLKYVKYGIAMGNSNPELFKHVKYKTDNIEDSGIYNGLKKMKLI